MEKSSAVEPSTRGTTRGRYRRGRHSDSTRKNTHSESNPVTKTTTATYPTSAASAKPVKQIVTSSLHDCVPPLMTEDNVSLLYDIRKRSMQPLSATLTAAPNATGGFQATAQWEFVRRVVPRGWVPSKVNGDSSVFVGSADHGSKETAKKNACLQLLKQFDTPPVPDLREAYLKILGKHATEKVVKETETGGQGVTVRLTLPSETQSATQSFSGTGENQEEAYVRALKALYLYISSPEAALLAPQASNPEVAESLQRTTTILARLGVVETEKQKGDGFHYEWQFTDALGRTRLLDQTVKGTVKKTARREARRWLLEELCLEQPITEVERAGVRSLRRMAVSSSDVASLAKETAKIIGVVSLAALSHALPTVWRRVLASQNLEHVFTILSALEATSKPISPSLWESLLDACCVLNSGRFGAQVLSMLTGGSEEAAVQRGVKLELDPSYFPSQEVADFYQKYSAMLAHELRAEITAAVASCRNGRNVLQNCNVPGLTALTFEPDEISCLTLSVVAVQFPTLKLRTSMNAEVDRFLQASNLRGDDDYVLLRPVTSDDRLGWSRASIVKVTNLTVTRAAVDMTLRVITEEETGVSTASAAYYEVYGLTTSVCHARMLEALKCLCLTVWSLDERRPKLSFSPAMRYMLLYPNLARSVATGSPPPADFLEKLAGNTDAPVPTTKTESSKGTARFRNNYASFAKMPDTVSADDLLNDRNITADLTAMQWQAISSALKNRLTLVQGPPGTGKTFVACKIVQVWQKQAPFRKVLVVADSNVAADHLSDGLRAMGIRSARVGAGSDVDVQDFMRHYDEDSPSSNFSSEFNKKRAFKYERMKTFKSMINSHPVVITTCIGSGHGMFDDHVFDRVLVDECGQSIEPATIVPLARQCEKLVLIGDHKQLPPTILSREALARGLSVSLLERLFASGIVGPQESCMLDVQRRMHPSIAEFPNYRFYQGKLKNHDETGQSRPAISGIVFPNPCVRVMFVNTHNKKNHTTETSSGVSKMNVTEAQLIPRIVRAIFQNLRWNEGSELSPKNVGIITPYSAQKRFILKLLSSSLPLEQFEGLEVGSVDGFQGKEKDLIIFSAVRSNANADVGFLSDGRRMNVALTRARRGLIVLGDAETLKHEPNWKQWIEWCNSRFASIQASSLKDYLGIGGHPDPRKAELAMNMVREGRVKNFWPELQKGSDLNSDNHGAKQSTTSGSTRASAKSKSAVIDDEDYFIQDPKEVGASKGLVSCESDDDWDKSD